MEFKRIGGASVVQNVIDQLTQAMLDNELKPGDKIPIETDLAEAFGVGRNSVREAIKMLVAFGILEIRRPEGTFVCSSFSQKMIDPFLYGIILSKGDSYDALKDFRKVIEEGIIKLCIKNHTDEDALRMKDAHAKLVAMAQEPGAELADIIAADDHFHKVIAQSSHNPMMEAISDLLRTFTTSKRYETTDYLLKHDIAYFKDNHNSIITTILERDESKIGALIPDKFFVDY